MVIKTSVFLHVSQHYYTDFGGSETQKCYFIFLSTWRQCNLNGRFTDYIFPPAYLVGWNDNHDLSIPGQTSTEDSLSTNLNVSVEKKEEKEEENENV